MNSASLAILSAIFFIAGLCLSKRTKSSPISVGLAFVMAASSMILAIFYGVSFHLTWQGINEWRKPITSFLDFSNIETSLEIDINQEVIRINNRKFRLPVLIELDRNLKSILKAEFDKSFGHKFLTQERHAQNSNQYFLLIDRCKNTEQVDGILRKNGFCLLAGQGKTYTKVELLDKNVSYTQNEVRQLLNIANGFVAYRVAHAGGGINGRAYTNSLEALNSNTEKGFRYFEIDFSFTKDDRLVCLHDWQGNFKSIFGFETTEKLTLKEFERLTQTKSKFHNCTTASLAEWMRSNPAAYIVTDVKEKNIEALKIILKELPNAEARVIPQVYYPDNLQTVNNLGFKNIIWTLYRFRGNNNEVLDWVDRLNIPLAITMPKPRAKSILPKELKRRNIQSYVHTINSAEEMREYINRFHVTEVYTDFLQP